MARDNEAALQARVAELEALVERLVLRDRQREEAAANPAAVIDRAFEDWKREAGRPASERTQDIADRTYGTEAPRFRVHLDPTSPDTGKKVNISEHFPLTLSAHSDLEAGARYQKLMGITKHDYRLVVEPAAA